ncbi:MAG: cupredoxin domain-containing protein [Anaerolineae bacterium]|nr:cupredoxin domain-containing protein [Anaerolineae bacterium]
MRRKLLYLAPFAVAAIVIFIPTANTQPPTIRHINLNATQFDYTPGRIEVNQGDEIILSLTSTDVVHGFYLDGYGIEQRLEPGITREVRFSAVQPGKFRYRCSVSCGPLHPFMIGELVVNSNLPFWRALGLLVSGIAGTLVYLWHFGGNEQ